MQNQHSEKNAQQTGLTKVQPKPKQKLDNTMTYHRWYLGMQCRKDILTQNQVINKKIINKVTPFTTKFQNQLKNNKMRFGYFIGFCLLFSMDKIYDLLILQNNNIQKTNRFIQMALSRKPNILKWQQQLKQTIKRTCTDQEKKNKLYNIFSQLDKQVILTPSLMNRLGQGSKKQNNYKYEYVDIGTFFQYFKDQKIDDIKSKIRGQFPYLGTYI